MKRELTFDEAEALGLDGTLRSNGGRPHVVTDEAPTFEPVCVITTDGIGHVYLERPDGTVLTRRYLDVEEPGEVERYADLVREMLVEVEGRA